MTNEVAQLRTDQAPAMAMDETELLEVLGRSLYPGASNESIKLVLGYCKASGLDPMQKPAHIVPMWDGKAKTMRDVIMPGIGLYRTQAARSGEYAGVSEPEFGEEQTETIDGCAVTYPLWCKVIVKRLLSNSTIAEFSATERWKENYAVKGGQQKSQAPNAMWFKRPYAQLAKCAEAQALRKAFPECGSAPTADEMEGKAIDITDQATVTTSDLPKEPEFYPDEDFNAFLPNWKKHIGTGALTAAIILAKIPNMSPDQINVLESCESTIEGEVVK